MRGRDGRQLGHTLATALPLYTSDRSVDEQLAREVDRGLVAEREEHRELQATRCANASPPIVHSRASASPSTSISSHRHIMVVIVCDVMAAAEMTRSVRQLRWTRWSRLRLSLAACLVDGQAPTALDAPEVVSRTCLLGRSTCAGVWRSSPSQIRTAARVPAVPVSMRWYSMSSRYPCLVSRRVTAMLFNGSPMTGRARCPPVGALQCLLITLRACAKRT